MKISEMNNDQAMDAMVRISGALNFILEDKEVRDLVEDLGSEKKGSTTLLDGFTKYMPRVVAIAAKKHRESLYEIVGALEGKDTKAVARMNFKRTIGVIMENWGELQDFFPSTAAATEATEILSGC